MHTDDKDDAVETDQESNGERLIETLFTDVSRHLETDDNDRAYLIISLNTDNPESGARYSYAASAIPKNYTRLHLTALRVVDEAFRSLKTRTELDEIPES